MKPSLLLLAYVLLTVTPLWSQKIFKTGEKEFTSKKEGSVITTRYYSRDFPSLPPDKDLSYLMPPAGNQGEQGSCWAWATAYVMRSTMDNPGSEHYFFDAGGRCNEQRVYSPSYTYQYYKGNIEDCNFGNYSADVLDRLLKDGAVPLDMVKYDDKKCNFEIKELYLLEARKHVMTEYNVVVVKDLFSMKKILADGHPMVISIRIDDYFGTEGNITRGNNTWSEFHNKIGDHAMVCVGYDDRKRAILVLNSWGKGFGTDGYAWIKYDIVSAALNYACFPEKQLQQFPETNKEQLETSFSNTVGLIGHHDPLWLKVGYYIPFDTLKIALADFSRKNGYAVIEIRDNNYRLLEKLYMNEHSSKEFSAFEQRYRLDFEKIDKAGNPFRFWNRFGVFFTVENITEKFKSSQTK